MAVCSETGEILFEFPDFTLNREEREAFGPRGVEAMAFVQKALATAFAEGLAYEVGGRLGDLDFRKSTLAVLRVAMAAK